jgi:predicted anti-sigma-YlaC factor YlaD
MIQNWQSKELEPLACVDVRELMGSDLDRDLTEAMHARVSEHLAGCESCRTEFATLAESLTRVQKLAESEDVPPAQWFAERTLRRLLLECGDSAAEVVPGEGQLKLWSA